MDRSRNQYLDEENNQLASTEDVRPTEDITLESLKQLLREVSLFYILI